jgi:hypothetical protein
MDTRSGCVYGAVAKKSRTLKVKVSSVFQVFKAVAARTRVDPWEIYHDFHIFDSWLICFCCPEATFLRCEEKLCQVYLEESMDLEVLRIFVELPIVKGSGSHMALSQFCT